MLAFFYQEKTIEESWMQVSQAYTRFFVRLIDYVPDIIGALFVIGFTALTARFAQRAVHGAMERTKADQNVRLLVVQSCSIMIWFVGIAVTLSVLHINTGGIFAALGITGAAIGFALKDIIANSVAGMVLIT